MKLPLDLIGAAAAGSLATAVHEARAAGNRQVDALHLLIALVRFPTPDIESMLRQMRVRPEDLLQSATMALPPPRPSIPNALPTGPSIYEAVAHALAAERLVAAAIGSPLRPIEPAHLFIGLMHGTPLGWRPFRRRRPSRASVILGAAGAYAPDAQRWLAGWRHAGQLPAPEDDLLE